jgi:hypothetical protein
MSDYRCYFLDAAGRVATSCMLECKTDAEAQTHADDFLADDYSGIELWNRHRMVYRASKVVPAEN